MTEPSTSTSADGPAKPARTIPTRKKPTAAGKAGRWVAAGGAVGASLALVGAMSAAADHDNADQPQETAEAVRRVVVVPQQDSAPNQIVIVLPESASTGAAQPVIQQSGTPQARPAVVAAPAKPAAPEPAPPAPAPVAVPVTESSGS